MKSIQNGITFNIEQWKEHAIACYPNEACAVVTQDGLLLCENKADDKEVCFSIDPVVFVKNVVLAVLHTHCISDNERPNIDPRTPSSADLNGQNDTCVPWGISATNGSECTDVLWFDGYDFNRPLLNRKFIHGVSDCYNIVRDVYWQCFNVELLNHPRDYEWLGDHISTYDDNYEQYGFFEVPKELAKPGDMMLMKLQSNVNNHAVVKLPGDMIVHHMAGRKSSLDRYSKWEKKISKVLRHKKIDELIKCDKYNSIVSNMMETVSQCKKEK